MNVDVYRTQKNLGDEQASSENGTRLAVALSKTTKSRDWKIIVSEMLMPRLEGARERADTSEGAELFRAQGEIRILKFLVKLENALIAQQQTIEYHGESQNEG